MESCSTTKRKPRVTKGTKLYFNRFLVRDRLGRGGFGEVFLAYDQERKQDVAIKVERMGGVSHLRKEKDILSILEAEGGFPNIYFAYEYKYYEFIVMDLLGPSIRQLFERCNFQFSLKTILMLTDQLLARLEQLHEKGILHRDIKPDNILMGHGPEEENKVFLVDFGLSKLFQDPVTKKHFPEKDISIQVGTPKYMSVQAHLRKEQGRRDDMESLAYTLLYFTSKGKLPWWKVRRDDRRGIYDMKMSSTGADLFSGMPNEFSLFVKKIWALGFDEKPNYSEYRMMFRELAWRLEYEYDWDFDWKRLPEPTKESPTKEIGPGRDETSGVKSEDAAGVKSLCDLMVNVL